MVAFPNYWGWLLNLVVEPLRSLLPLWWLLGARVRWDLDDLYIRYYILCLLVFAHGLIQHALRVTGRIYNIDWFTFTPLCLALHEAIRFVALLGYADIIGPFCPTLGEKYLKHPSVYYDI